jgi:hypothetical protein
MTFWRKKGRKKEREKQKKTQKWEERRKANEGKNKEGRN